MGVLPLIDLRIYHYSLELDLTGLAQRSDKMNPVKKTSLNLDNSERQLDWTQKNVQFYFYNSALVRIRTYFDQAGINFRKTPHNLVSSFQVRYAEYDY